MLGDADGDTSANTSKGGRPKGSTNAHKRDVETKYKKCVDSITEDYVALLLALKRDCKKRLPKGALSNLISQKKRSIISPETFPSKLFRAAFAQEEILPLNLLE